jgi:flagella basal body P-ring formation protein FlgA
MRAKSLIKLIAMLAVMLIIGGPSRALATESQTLNIGWLMESARSMILTTSPWAGSGCTVDINGSPPDIVVYRSGHLDVRAVLERTPNGLRDIGAVSVEVYTGGELYMRFDPSPYLLVTVPVYTTAHDIDRGTILSENDVTETPVDVRNLPADETIESLDEIVGLAARTNIQSGRIITDGMLEPPTMVIRGETVIVYIPIGSASVTLHGIALDSGAVGESVRVRNPDSGTIITATVIGPSMAEISLL